jgi:hypothetical protein
MRTWIRAAAAVAICIASVAAVSSAELSPCDFGNHGALGRNVLIRGRFGFTRHGMVIMTNGCKSQPYAAVVLFPNTAYSPQVEFEVDPQAVERLQPFFRVNGGYATACGVLSGALFQKRHFRRGYGPTGIYRFALVLRSVDEIRPCD